MTELKDEHLEVISNNKGKAREIEKLENQIYKEFELKIRPIPRKRGVNLMKERCFETVSCI